MIGEESYLLSPSATQARCKSSYASISLELRLAGEDRYRRCHSLRLLEKWMWMTI